MVFGIAMALAFSAGAPLQAGEKEIGVYYSTWFSFPTNWTNTGGCVWAEPALGWYESADPAVIDQHTEWLVYAGVDFVIIDWSNNCGNIDGDRSKNGNLWAIEDNTQAFVDRQVWRKANGLSYVEYAIFLGGCGNDDNFTNGFFNQKANEFIKPIYLDDPGRNELYYRLHGQPFLGIWGPEHLTPYVHVDNFHTQKIGTLLGNAHSQYNHSDYWSWEEYITPGYSVHNGQPEAMTVHAGLRGTGLPPGMFEEYPDGLPGWLNDGTVHGNAAIPRNNGDVFRDQLDQAIASGVRIILVQSFNEWTGCPENPGEEMDPDRSNDIEPMAGGHGDLYLQILREYATTFKEVSEATYDFDDGTLQGWTDLTPPNSNSGPRHWAPSPPAFPGVAHRGSGAIGQVISGGTQDSSHPTLWLRSPEFLLDGSGDLTVWLRGGAGSGSLAGLAAGSVPAQSSNPGFQGVALRNANTDVFVLSGSRTNSGDNWQQVRFTAAQLAALEQNAVYTLDLIDAGHGGWGWIAMDTVTIPGTFSGDEPASPPTISSIADQTIPVDSDTGALSFTVGSAEVDPGTLTLSGSSSNTTLVPNANIVFGGSGADRTVTVTPAADQTGVTTITVTVGDGDLTASTTFTVNVVTDALPIEFDFAAGTFGGWTEVSTDAEGRQHFAVVPPGVHSPNTEPHSGGHFIGLHIPAFSLDEPVYTQDQPHETLVFRSPEFTLNGAGDLVAWLSGGGAGAPSLAGTSVGALPSESSDEGFMGIALRNVNTGNYMLSGTKTSVGNEWEQVGFSASELAALPQDHVYTLDLIDARHGNWGWVNMDSVTIPGALVHEPGIPEMPILLIRRSGRNEVRLSWPAEASGWTLQRAPEAGGEYTDAGLEATVEGDENVVYDTILSSRQFYRLTED